MNKIKYVCIYAILALFIGCGASGGGSGGNIAHPSNPCILDGSEALWWLDLDGSLNYQNQSVTTYHPADEFWLTDTFVIEWNCSVDRSIDLDNHKIIRTFENQSGWVLVDTQVSEPVCTCGG